MFTFSVKFYTPDPCQLEEEYTRYLFALQIKRDLSLGRLVCNDNTGALLASFIVQAEIGDFVPEAYLDHSYLSTFSFLPSPTTTTTTAGTTMTTVTTTVTKTTTTTKSILDDKIDGESVVENGGSGGVGGESGGSGGGGSAGQTPKHNQKQTSQRLSWAVQQQAFEKKVRDSIFKSKHKGIY